MLTYEVGDLFLALAEFDSPVVAHVVSDARVFAAGFAAQLAYHYPEARDAYRAWAEGKRSPFKLGLIQLVPLGDMYVANLLAQQGLRGKYNPVPLHYEALESCLDRLAAACARAKLSTILMPRIGCGLAGGDWSRVEPMIEDRLAPFDVHVFSL